MEFPSTQSILFGKQYLGIEHFSTENEEKTAFLEVRRKKNELVISKEDIRIFKDSVLELMSNKVPFYLVINTNQVIQKEIEETDTSDNKLLHKAFPNLRWEDFYYEIWRLKHKSIICICRKSYVEVLIAKYQKKKLSISNISLGNTSISSLLNISKPEKLETNNHTIRFNNDDITISSSVNKNIFHYDINGLQISNPQVLAFTAILQSILNRKLITSNLTGLNLSLRDAYLQKQFFNKGIQIGIGILLTILLINFFVFTTFYKKVQENSQTLLLNNSSKEAFIKLKNRIKLKEESAQKIYGKTKTSSTLILNEITKRLPASILLSEFVYQPLEKKIKKGEPILIQNKVLLISGSTINTESFTNWIEALEKLNFINKVIITNFGKNENSETIFSLKLLINETE